ncbi:MAG: phage holin family protein [Sphingosinicella sp.]|nr:phage holin family protein [Sphingosinicella sp.]
MDARTQNPTTDTSIGDLFGQLVDDGRTLVRAEVDLYKEVALYRAGKAKTGALAMVAGGLIAYAGLIAALVGIVLGLADFVGPVLSGLIVLAVAGATGFLLIRYGAGKMAALSGDTDEKAALAVGERSA